MLHTLPSLEKGGSDREAIRGGIILRWYGPPPDPLRGSTLPLSGGGILHVSTIWVWVTMATSLPSSRAIRVCHTELRRPICSGVDSATTVVPSGAGEMKLVLL